MTKSKTKGGKSSGGPYHVKTRTQLIITDMDDGAEMVHPDEITPEQLEKDIQKLNPDIDSMESRG